MRYEDKRLAELESVLPSTARYLHNMLYRHPAVRDEFRTILEGAVHELSLRYRAARLMNAGALDGVVNVARVNAPAGEEAVSTVAQHAALRILLPNTVAALEWDADLLTEEDIAARRMATAELWRRRTIDHLSSRNKVDVTWISNEDMYDTLGEEVMQVLQTGDTLMYEVLANPGKLEGNGILAKPPTASPFGNCDGIFGDANPDRMPGEPPLHPPQQPARSLWRRLLDWLLDLSMRMLRRGNRAERQNTQTKERT